MLGAVEEMKAEGTFGSARIEAAFPALADNAIGLMRSLVVHGVCDKLSGCDSLYLFLDSRSRAELYAQRGFVALAHLLVCQIDVAWRRVAAVQLDDLPAAQLGARPRQMTLSE